MEEQKEEKKKKPQAKADEIELEEKEILELKVYNPPDEDQVSSQHLEQSFLNSLDQEQIVTKILFGSFRFDFK